jgi:hypothetical protein
MVTQVTSSTDPTNDRGVAVNCQCKRRRFGAICQHMVGTQVQINQQKAARFAALRLMVQGMEETARANREMACDARFA